MSTNDDLTPNIAKLELGDTFYTWFNATNKLIEYVNPIQLYDVSLGAGLTETRLAGTVTIDLNVGKGIRLFPSIGDSDLTVDIEGVYSSLATVQDNDYVMFQRPSTDNENNIFSVVASDILPPTINDNHEFLGEITVNSFNCRYPYIYAGYGNAGSSESGFVLFPTETYEQSLLFNTAYDAWIPSSNVLIKNNKSFLSDSLTKDSIFRFSTNGTQYDVVFEMAMGIDSTTSDDHSWKIEARHYFNTLEFVYSDTVNTEVDTVTFSSRIDDVYTGSSTFIIADKIEIGDVGGSSTNFKQVTDYTANIIPISNSYGVLDKKWTNRYVTDDYSGIVVGNLVKVYEDTNETTTITRCDLTTSSTDEADTFTFGIVERISGGKAYIAMLGEFNLQTTPSPTLVPGTIYYLTTGTTNYTSTKPTTGLVKPVFIATGESSGIVFPMTSNALSFGNVSVSAAGGAETGYIIGAGSTVYSNASNGNVQLIAGNGITLETNNTTKAVTIRAITQGNEPGYSTIYGDSGTTLQAITPYDALSISGNGGGIEVITENNTNTDHIVLQGSYFRSIAITGDETDSIDATITAGVDAELTLYGGVGIRLTNPAANLIRIEATGDLAATIANYSLTLTQIQKQPKNSVLYTEPASGALSDISTLQATERSLLLYTGSNMTWATPISFFSTSVTEAISGTIRPSSTRFLGISAHVAGNTTPIGGVDGTASFMYDSSVKPNSINNVRMALIQGSGITLEVVNNTGSGDYVGVPGIKISNNDTTTKFKKVYVSNTGETIEADASGILTFTSPSGSPIVLDSDTNSDTVYFSIGSNSITNSHLETMADNTVKVGIGNTDNTPTDLFIEQNSILGRLTGDLQSLDSTDILSILGLSGTSYFNEVLTNNGTVSATTSETLSIVGGTGISVQVNTNNEVEIINTLPEGMDADLGISTLGTRSMPVSGVYTNTDIATGVDKMYFGIGDLEYTVEQVTSSIGAVTPKISWKYIGKTDGSQENSSSQGSGLLYGKPSGSTFTSQFSQIGNGVTGWRIPYFDPSTGSLSYFAKDTVVHASTNNGRLLAFADNGSLTTTNSYVSALTTNITGLKIVNNSGDFRIKEIQEDTTNPLEFEQYKSILGTYWFSDKLAIQLENTNEFVFATSKTVANFSTTVKFEFASSLTLNTTSDPPVSNYTSITGTDIKVRQYSSNWYGLTAQKLCLPTNIVIGDGPTTGDNAGSSGYVIKNDSSTGALVLTNYNLNVYGSRTTEKDRSSKLTLEVLNVDPGASTSFYNASKTVGSIVHCYPDPTTLSSSGIIDTFTVSTRKSIKYLIQAIQTTTNKLFTSEFIVQANNSTNTCNYIQYASVVESGGFTLDISATINSGVVTVSCNSVTQGLSLSSVKIMKIEI